MGGGCGVVRQSDFNLVCSGQAIDSTFLVICNSFTVTNAKGIFQQVINGFYYQFVGLELLNYFCLKQVLEFHAATET